MLLCVLWLCLSPEYIAGISALLLDFNFFYMGLVSEFYNGVITVALPTLFHLSTAEYCLNRYCFYCSDGLSWAIGTSWGAIVSGLLTGIIGTQQS